MFRIKVELDDEILDLLVYSVNKDSYYHPLFLVYSHEKWMWISTNGTVPVDE